MREDAPDGELVSRTLLNVLKWLDERDAAREKEESGMQNADVLVVAEVSVS